MGIYILEDEANQVELLKEIIISINQRYDCEGECPKVYRRGEMLLLDLKSNTETNIFFLDIQIRGILDAGIGIAQKIRDFDKKAIIVFVSTHRELALDVLYSFVSPLSFVEKNLDLSIFTSKIEKSLREYYCLREVGDDDDVFHLKLRKTEIKIPFSEIYYFTSTYAHRVEMVSKVTFREFHGDLIKIEREDDRLERVHQSYIVNPGSVVQIDKTMRRLIFPNGDFVPISRKHYKHFLDKYQKKKKGCS